MALVEANGTQLWVEERGDGPPALFVHGMCGGAWVWSDQIERLGLAPCLVVSSSGGAEVAVDLIRRHPEHVRGAVLSEPPLFALDEEAATEFAGEVGPAVEAAIAAAGGDRRGAVDGFFDTVCPGLWSEIDEARKDRYRDNVAMLFAALEAGRYPLTVDDLARVRVPCLVLAGSVSGRGLRTIARKLAASISDCRFLELEGSGHVTYAERPAEFAEAVESFAAELAVRT